MADTLAIQQTAHVIDRAGKLAFHSKRQHLTPMDVVAASGEQGYGGAALPQLLHVPDADLLYRFEADLSASETVRAQQLPAAPLELYYSMVRRALQHKAGGAGEGPLTVRAVTASLATDPGLQPVLPYLVPLLADEVGRNLKDVQQLRVVLR
ncbi:hypothetical protein CHLNCDRAFT_139708 [Chlorella variabilis]|uniref:TAF6 C-terminal HEAT repeat domain-containing protein n=1 Tax=Chlorella variabilis TaxID=554065 RepID=E1ZQR6_CHLVA|nr:hypothetical protein CHLNCDRAFT_139708 [Chlorella variabilis]EFN51843.1 hypothetical protein CHLNCDRAFT_139708 [Chlorella variabilis]|eukprot:XP_005843945.1 hypothetical protein CHLNCDRAFT_139708 [Chlorella variabilis]